MIQRNVLENPGWYTAYTPYQAEIAQGRLEALLNFQTMVVDLTGLPDRQRLAARRGHRRRRGDAPDAGGAARQGATPVFLVDEHCHPQTIAVVRTRAEARGIERRGRRAARRSTFGPGVIGALVQYPATDGAVRDFRALCERAHAAGALVTAATDLLALTLLTPPGEWGADIAVGNSQRFGVPLGYGGPHAAFFATRDEYKRLHARAASSASRAIATASPALRMALQTREQHIRREKATSNICTAQVLLAVMASMYAVYHGPEGLRRIAERVHAPRRAAGERAPAAAATGWCTRRSSTPSASRCAEWALPRLLDAARGADDQPPPLPPTRLVHRARRDGDAGRPGRPASRSSRSNEALPVHAGGHRRRSASARSRRRSRGQLAYLAHPVFNRTTPRPRCCATSSGSRRATCRSRAR